MNKIPWKVNLSICKFYNKILTILFEFDYVLFDISIYLLGIESIIEKVLKQPADEVTFNEIVTFWVFISLLEKMIFHFSPIIFDCWRVLYHCYSFISVTSITSLSLSFI